jgi:hypothetical protein
MKLVWLVALLALALAGCESAEAFRRGDVTSARVAKLKGDACHISVTISSSTRGFQDEVFVARVVNPECNNK